MKSGFFFFILSLVRKNESKKARGPAKMAKISVLGAKTSKLPFVFFFGFWRRPVLSPSLLTFEVVPHRRFLTLHDEYFFTPFMAKAVQIPTSIDGCLRMVVFGWLFSYGCFRMVVFGWLSSDGCLRMVVFGLAKAMSAKLNLKPEHCTNREERKLAFYPEIKQCQRS